MHRDRMRGMDDMFGDMFRQDPMMALTDGRDGDRRHRHRDHGRHGQELHPGHTRGSDRDVAPYGGRHDPFSFMSSMMSNMHSMMGNAFQQMVCTLHYGFQTRTSKFSKPGFRDWTRSNPGFGFGFRFWIFTLNETREADDCIEEKLHRKYMYGGIQSCFITVQTADCIFGKTK